MENSVCPLDRLPHEVWLKIFSYLKTTDIISFSKSHEKHEDILFDKPVIQYFDVGGDFHLYKTDIRSFIMIRTAYEHIKSLNVNKLYWIPLKDLRKLLHELVQLEEFFALDTKIGLREKDVKNYGKLKTLAVSVDGRDLSIEPSIIKTYMDNLRKFGLKIISKPHNYNDLYNIFRELVGVEELWINHRDDYELEPIKYDIIVSNLKFLKKFVIKSKVTLPILDYKSFGLARYFETRRFKSIVMCYEFQPNEIITNIKSISLFEPFETAVESAWDVIHKFHCEMPYGPKSAQEFYLKKQIKDIYFDELNFYHNISFCNPSFVRATWDFLTSENSRNLQKLSVRSCAFQQKSFKRNRHDNYSVPKKYPIMDVIKNCENLKVLELMACSNHDLRDTMGNTICNVTILEAYNFLSNWVNLERLTIEIPNHLCGKFLKEVLTQCKTLKYLRIISLNANESLDANMCSALSYGKSLEDFWYKNKYMNLARIFESLCRLESRKLRRIYLDFDKCDVIFNKQLDMFLRRNDQVIFMLFYTESGTQKWVYFLQEHLLSYSNSCPSKIYLARKRDKIFYGACPVPITHREFIDSDTEVSTIDMYSFR